MRGRRYLNSGEALETVKAEAAVRRAGEQIRPPPINSFRAVIAWYAEWGDGSMAELLEKDLERYRSVAELIRREG